MRREPARLLGFDQNRHVLRGTLDQLPLHGPLLDWDKADIVRRWARAEGLLPGAVLPTTLLVDLLPQLLEVGPDFGVASAADGIVLWYRRDEPLVAIAAALQEPPARGGPD